MPIDYVVEEDKEPPISKHLSGSKLPFLDRNTIDPDGLKDQYCAEISKVREAKFDVSWRESIYESMTVICICSLQEIGYGSKLWGFFGFILLALFVFMICYMCRKICCDEKDRVG